MGGPRILKLSANWQTFSGLRRGFSCSRRFGLDSLRTSSGADGRTVRPKIILPVESPFHSTPGGYEDIGCHRGINKDAEAPIFKIATYGIVADLFTASLLTQEFKKRLEDSF